MLKNYGTLILRMTLRQRGFSFINLAGLTIGITCSLLLVIYIEDELNFDRFHPDYEQIYRIGFRGKLEGNEFNTAETPAPLAQELQMQSTNVTSVLRVAHWPTFPIRYEDQSYTEPYLLLADSNFFSFFNFSLTLGDPQTVLKGPDKLVISESTARKYFGDSIPAHQIIGKQFTLAQGYKATISGIASDAPSASHFHFTFILSAASWPVFSDGIWAENPVHTYIKLKPEANLGALESLLDSTIKTNLGREIQERYQTDLEKMNPEENAFRLFIQPLASIHLQSNLSDEIEPPGNLSYIQLFAAIAIFITLLACINFVNLSTARSASRAKEVGVRKTLGARNGQLIRQFLMESYFYTILAVLISLGVIALVLVPFNLIVGKTLTTAAFSQPYFLGSIGLFILILGLLSGSYPAFFLTYFSPAQILKGNLRSGVSSHQLRNILVAVQFFISIGLIIATLVIYQQVRYIQQRSVGFDRSNLIALLHTANLEEHAADFKHDLLALPGIKHASFANRLPPHLDWNGVFKLKDSEKDYLMSVYEMDEDHLATMGYEVIQGRAFQPGDTAVVLVNETAAHQLGIQQLAGQRIFTTYDGASREREIIGIVKDFNFRSLREPVTPLVMVPGKIPNWEMAIRIESENEQNLIEQLKKLWTQHAPGAPFEYSFIEDNYRDAYQAEEKIGEVFITFTLLAMVIASLGLYGLATYTTVQRTKEIGIRKVLGASTYSIAVLMVKDFTKVTLIAFVLAAPLEVWVLNRWLDQYPYRIEIIPWNFVITTVIILLLTIATVSYQAIRAALMNPVKTLRNE